ncbi:MAG: flippase-like domain-containing protein [Candidatus Cloacimonetes bacterium]|nr:flippase-like domain-containing protein [Candidatus Cloacimonadota bacterium]MBS3767706.1 flippase-like domain-containing protein [Candidatus Cloacimonadota bacterium]
MIKNKKLLFRIIISVLFLIFLFIIVKPTQIVSTLKRADTTWVLLIFLLLPINILFQFIRWRYLVKSCVDEVDNKEIIQSIFYSFSYSIFTPARLGDIGRAFHITHEKKKELVAFAVYEKLFAFISILMLGMIALTVYQHILFILGAIIPVLILIFSNRITAKIPKVKYHIKKLKRVNPFGLFIISVLFVFIYAIQFYFALNAFCSIPFLKSFFLIILVIFFNSIPITLSGLGVREVLSVYFFENLGVAAAEAAGASLLIFFINILIPTFIGFILHLIPKNKTSAA